MRVPPGKARTQMWPILCVAAGVVMVIGSFLPWATISDTYGQQASLRGITGGDGWVSVGCGLIIGLAGVASLSRPQRLATVAVDLGALAASILTIYEFAHVTSQSGVLSASNAGGIYDIGIGAGLGLVGVAAVVSLISAAGITGRDARAEMAA